MHFRNRSGPPGVPCARTVNEAQAIALARSGDTGAFAWLIGTYKHMVHTACYRVLRHREEAEEATQDSFVKAYQHLRGFTGSSKFSTWLFSIAYRTAVSHARRRRTDGGSVDELSEHPASGPEAAAPAGDVKENLDRALAQLPADDASLLSFYYLEEMSVDEIITVTGLGASNVKVKLHRGRKKLADVLERQLGPEARALLLNDA